MTVNRLGGWLYRRLGSPPAPRITMTLHAHVAAQLRAALEDPNEIAGVLIVTPSNLPDEIRLLAREFHPAAAYVTRTPTSLNLAPEAYFDALSRTAALGAVAVFVHSHPSADPRRSPDDREVDEQLRSVFQNRTESPFYGSVVLRLEATDLSFTGLLWKDEDLVGPIILMREFADRFRFISSLDTPSPLPADATFNRQVLAFGGAVQALLRSLHIGVVGAGGTGSATAELLIRSGVGRVTVVDYQDLEDTNVTRVYGSSLRQVGRRKVDVVVESARRIGLGTRVDPIGRKLDRTALESLQACDLIFACTDDHAGRLDVARLAYWCLVPVIDMAVKLDAVNDPHQGIYCRVDLQMPGEPCVQCADVVDPDLMRAEGLSDEERSELEEEGYLPGQHNRDPAVIVYTSLTANLAMSELLVRLTGIGPGESPSRLMFYGHLRHLGQSRLSADPHWCARPESWGAIHDERGLYLGRVWPG